MCQLSVKPLFIIAKDTKISIGIITKSAPFLLNISNKKTIKLMGGIVRMEKLDIFIIIAAIAIALALLVGVFGGAAVETGSWGLSFPVEG